MVACRSVKDTAVNLIYRTQRKLYRWKALKKPRVADTVAPRRIDPEHPVHFIITGANLEDILEKMRRIQDVVFAGFRPDDRVLFKVNLNSSFPYPASTSPEMLVGLIEVLKQRGLQHLTVGDCSSISYLPTMRVARDTGLLNALKAPGDKTDFAAFDRRKWMRIVHQGRYWDDVVVTKCVFEADRIVDLCNMKTHSLADFSLGMKHLVGFLHPSERGWLHRENLQEKIAELSTLIQPDLTIIDARQMFISGGPNEGETRQGDRIFVGNNLPATDLAAYRYLYSIKDAHGRIEQFSKDPFRMRQFQFFQNQKDTTLRDCDWQTL